MKRFLSIILCLTMLLGVLTACGKQVPPTTDAEDTTAGENNQNDSVEEPKGNAPYQIKYESNGDGTCYVSEIAVTGSTEEPYTLTIPEKSPEGDTVTELRHLGFFSVPVVITKAYWDKIDAIINPMLKFDPLTGAPVFSAIEDLEMRDFLFEYWKMKSFYEVYDPTNNIVSVSRINEWKTQYGVDLYVTPVSKLLADDLSLMTPKLVRISETWSRLLEFCGEAEDAWLVDLENTITIKENYDKFQFVLGSGDATNLQSVVLPKTMTKIGNNSFAGCVDLESISLPEALTSIGACAFSGCSSLTSINIPNGITSINDFTFSGCSSLTGISIPATVKTIGSDAFSECDQLEGVYISDIASWCAIEFSDEDSNPLTKAHKLYLNETLLTELVIPDGVTTVNSYAFYGAKYLSEITIPKSVIQIGADAFTWTGAYMNRQYWYDDNFYIGDCLVMARTSSILYGTRLIAQGAGLCETLPDTLETICDGAFEGSGLESITIPNGVTRIGAGAFANCDRLKEVTLPESLTEIEAGMFYGCYQLKEITLPKTLTKIGAGAFSDCLSLECINITDLAFYPLNAKRNVKIPASVTSIGENAFFGCKKLTEIYYLGSESAWLAMNPQNFGISQTATIYCGDEAKKAPVIAMMESLAATKTQVDGYKASSDLAKQDVLAFTELSSIRASDIRVKWNSYVNPIYRMMEIEQRFQTTYQEILDAMMLLENDESFSREVYAELTSQLAQKDFASILSSISATVNEAKQDATAMNEQMLLLDWFSFRERDKFQKSYAFDPNHTAAS